MANTCAFLAMRYGTHHRMEYYGVREITEAMRHLPRDGLDQT